MLAGARLLRESLGGGEKTFERAPPTTKGRPTEVVVEVVAVAVGAGARRSLVSRLAMP